MKHIPATQLHPGKTRSRGVMNLQPVSRPLGVFRGTNVMTPNVLGYYKLNIGYAELSTGRGFDGNKLFGVTVRPDVVLESQGKRSKCCFSKAEALAYLGELS